MSSTLMAGANLACALFAKREQISMLLSVLLLSLSNANVEKIMILNPKSNPTLNADLNLKLPIEHSQILSIEIEPKVGTRLSNVYSSSVANPNFESHEIRVCWPATYPVDFQLTLQNDGYIRIDAVYTGIHTKLDKGKKAVKFRITSERLIFNVLPVSTLYVIVYIAAVLILGVAFVLPQFDKLVD